MVEALQFEFMRNAFLAGLLASIACGIIGSYVVVKRVVFISGGVAHSAYGGIGLGYFLGFNPIWGAILFSVAAALGIGVLSKKTSQREDTLIGVMWASGMALGVVLISLAPGYAADLFSYLFGSILAVPTGDIMLMLALDVIIVSMVVLLYKEFLALSFDEEFAVLAGVPQILYLVLLCLVALTVVILIRVVGIILVIAMLTIPAAISVQFTCSLKKMMILATALGAFFITSGLWLSYAFDVPSGATIILVAGFCFMISVGYKCLSRRKTGMLESGAREGSWVPHKEY